MKWIELIRVRSSEEMLRTALPELEEQVEGIATATANAETFILQHALYEGDLAVAIVWRTDTKPAKSREGLLVAIGLQGLGAIDHAVWLPIEQLTTKEQTP
ncbi:MAG: hypothetical protein AAFS10_14260 [Myxococcota bacterium]